MNKKINPALIGAFILLATAMVVVSLIYFGADTYGKDSTEHVAYFRTETNGLEVGAPVVLQGVKIGSVKSIDVGYDASSNNIYVKVNFVTKRQGIFTSGETQQAEKTRIQTKTLIEKGLRARLAMQTLLTGKLMVEVGFFPNTPVRLQTDNPEEIPTIPNTIEKLWQQIASIDFAKMGAGIENIVTGMDQLVNNVDLHTMEEEALATLKLLQQATGEFQQMVTNMDEKVDSVAAGFNQASAGITTLADNMDQQMAPLMKDIRQILKTADNTLSAATGVMEEADGLLSDNSPLKVEMTQALQNISEAARSLKGFAEYLERHPEALLKGK